MALVKAACAKLGVEALMADHWADGSKGAEDLARAVQRKVVQGDARAVPLYPESMPLAAKIRTIAQKIYRAGDILMNEAVARRLEGFEKAGFGHVPVCIAKTQYSFTTNADVKGAPTDHVTPVREVRLSAGAEFVVAICGEIMTMPGLPKVPAANSIDLGEDGRIVGLF